MVELAVLLSGEHATLPTAELRALLAVHAPTATLALDGLMARVDVADREVEGARVAAHRMALAYAWGDLWGTCAAAPDAVAAVVRSRADGRGRAGVTFERRGHGKGPGAGAMALQAAAGRALAAAGHPIDLAAPERAIELWIQGDQAMVVEKQGAAQAWAYAARAVDNRAHFSPVSLHPRRAAALLHLARVAPGGRVYDPCCGTGAFVLEAAVEGYDAWGSDIDAFMVQGTLQSLADAADAPLHGTAFVADVGAGGGLVEGVAGIVTDLPYGRASSTQGEGVASLYARAFGAFADLLPPGGRAVVGMADATLLELAGPAGLTLLETHTERVHRSLTRTFGVLVRG